MPREVDGVLEAASCSVRPLVVWPSGDLHYLWAPHTTGVRLGAYSSRRASFDRWMRTDGDRRQTRTASGIRSLGTGF